MSRRIGADPCEVVVPGAVGGNHEEAVVLVGEQQLHLLVEVRLVVGQVLVLDMGGINSMPELQLWDRFK